MMKQLPLISGAAFAIMLLAAPFDANAYVTIVQASGACQGALPAFDTELRARPLAVQNEGSQTAYVSCSLTQIETRAGTNFITSATIHLVKNTSATRTVSCTAVNVGAGANPNSALYATKSVQLSGSSSTIGSLSFTGADFSGSVIPGDSLNFSCSLPPGVGITTTVMESNRE